MSSPQKVRAGSMPRINSLPGNFDGSVDRPMRLAEIFIASEHALKQTISNTELLKSLSSLEDFEVFSCPGKTVLKHIENPSKGFVFRDSRIYIHSCLKKKVMQR